MKQIIADQVDGMETTLAHLFPELTANIAGPVMIIIYLFILDWRMALLLQNLWVEITWVVLLLLLIIFHIG